VFYHIWKLSNLLQGQKLVSRGIREWCPTLKIEVVNVVATVNTGHSIDLPRLARQPQITYSPSRYFRTYFMDHTMEAKVSVFESGKLIAVGAKSEN